MEYISTFHTWLNDTVIERLLDIADHFIYKKHITVSEGFLWTVILGRAIWYPLYGVSGGVVENVFTPFIWSVVFIILAMAHLIAFAVTTVKARAVIVAIYAFIWMFLTILAISSDTNTPAAPTFAAMAILGSIVALRLYSDKPSNVL